MGEILFLKLDTLRKGIFFVVVSYKLLDHCGGGIGAFFSLLWVLIWEIPFICNERL